MAENKILKEQNQINEPNRDEYRKRTVDCILVEDENVETEKRNEKAEYRRFLLQQIEDKEKDKKKNSPKIKGNSYTYSEELIAPEMKQNLKLAKQQEMKEALDECIRMKNALKLENKQKEIEEERVRMELVKKRETDELMVRQLTKQQTEVKEQRKEEAARQLISTTKDKVDERQEFINILLKKDTTLSERKSGKDTVGEKTQPKDDSAEHVVESFETCEELTQDEVRGELTQDDVREELSQDETNEAS